MTSTQTVVTRVVRNYLHDSGISQQSLAAELGVTQATLSRKLSGIRTWSLDDLDQLIQIGVPIGLDIFGAAINEEYTREVTR
jgi:DNA-binding helix-turn-helix protein